MYVNSHIPTPHTHTHMHTHTDGNPSLWLSSGAMTMVYLNSKCMYHNIMYLHVIRRLHVFEFSLSHIHTHTLRDDPSLAVVRSYGIVSAFE